MQSVAHLSGYRRSGVADPTGTEQWLRAAASSVLDNNWLGSSTVPSRSLYPHQWSWDSAFIALGLRHLSPQRAQREPHHELFAIGKKAGIAAYCVCHVMLPPWVSALV